MPPATVSGGGDRGEVLGWSAAAVRRHTIWLQSVEAPALERPVLTPFVRSHGYALTLTCKRLPFDAGEWQSMRRAFDKRMQRHRAGFVRGHWVVEWQKRGVPHLHLAVYFGRALTARERAFVLMAWVEVCREAQSLWHGPLPEGVEDEGDGFPLAVGASFGSQTIEPITGAVGWLKYLSKHAGRGVQHYQRQGKPDGWRKTGRMWGHGGQWPVDEPFVFELTGPEGYRVRRMLRAWRLNDARKALAEARRSGDAKRVRQAKRRVISALRSLRCRDPRLSAVRGMREWAGEVVTLPLVALVLDQRDAAGWDPRELAQVAADGRTAALVDAESLASRRLDTAGAVK